MRNERGAAGKSCCASGAVPGWLALHSLTRNGTGRPTGRSTAEIQDDRETHALALAAEARHLVVVLKGAETIVTDGKKLYVNTTGNPGMATGGSGDALTGVIAALIAQKMDPFDAACLGVYAHGLAGDIARDQNGEVGMVAGDIVDSLADAFHHLAP